MKISIEQVEALNDEQLIKLLDGKIINLIYKDDTSYMGKVTEFINASQAECTKRRIVAIVLDGDNEIGISSQSIISIELL